MKAVYFNNDTIINLETVKIIRKNHSGPYYTIQLDEIKPMIEFDNIDIRDREFANILAFTQRSGDGVHKISKTGNPL